MPVRSHSVRQGPGPDAPSRASAIRTAIVCLYPALPPTGGAGSVTASLAGHFPGPCTLFQLGDAESPADRPDLEIVSLGSPPPNRWVRARQVPIVTRRLLAALRGRKIGAVVLEGASWAGHLWWIFRRLRREFPELRILYHAHNIEYELRCQRHTRWIAALTKWAERQLVRGSDLTFATSEDDADKMAQLYGVRPAILPNGVDPRRFDGLDARAVEALRRDLGLGTPSLLFTGAYAYPPNREALDFLCREVLPRLHASNPNVTLLVLGGVLPHRAAWIRNPGLVPHDQMPTHVAAAHIGLAPIFSGSGTRLKILEYMAAGLPVVATPKGAEGLGLEHEQDLLLASTPAEFEACVRRLGEDSSLADRLGRRGKSTIAARFSWSRLMADLAVHLQAVIRSE